MSLLVLTLRSIWLVLGLVARTTWSQFIVLACVAVFGLTLQACMMWLCSCSLYAFVYGWTEVAYRLAH